MHGYPYEVAVIEERTTMDASAYLEKLSAWIARHVTQTTINQDLNTLMSSAQFGQIRGVLKEETLRLLRDEIARLQANLSQS